MPTPAPQLSVYDDPASAYSAQLVIPGTVGAGLLGLLLGGAISAVLHRPMWKGASNAGLKLGAATFAYLGGVAGSSRRLPREYADQRMQLHMANGVATGAVLGAVTGRGKGMIRGAVAGAVIAVPLWWMLEGRYQHAQDIAVVERQRKATNSNSNIAAAR